MTRHAPIVVAARSARMLAEAAAHEGHDVIALDAFGDADTRRAAGHWQSIATRADGSAPRVAPARLLDALATAALKSSMRAAPLGWIAGSDLECEPGLLEAGAKILPLIGSAPSAVRNVRDPATFFTALDDLQLAHPETRLDTPGDEGGWLRKDARGCGGWHIRRVAPGPVDAAQAAACWYFQREGAGQPMSALFVAGSPPLAGPPLLQSPPQPFGLSLAKPQARHHHLVGLNELIVRPYGAHPHVYRGAIGPVALPRSAQLTLGAAIDALVERFGLRGLCSLDFLWHDGIWSLLEINPRPSASMALYRDLPLIAWQLAACGFDAPSAAPADPTAMLRGIETVFARRAFELGAAHAAALHARSDCHDLPAAGTSFAPGDPVCSLSAVGNNPVELRAVLAAQRQALREQLAA